MRDEDNQPCTSTTAGPPPIMRKRTQTPSSSTYSVSRALSTSLASRPSATEAARITATTTNKFINVMPIEAMIAQQRGLSHVPRVCSGPFYEPQRLLTTRRIRTEAIPVESIEITRFCVSSFIIRHLPKLSTDRSRGEDSTPSSRCALSADPFAPVVAVEAFQLGAEEGTVVEAGQAVYAEKHLLRASRVQIVIHHEIEEFPVFLTDLIHELRERYAARDKSLARFVGIQLPQTAVGVPHDEPRGDVPETHSLLHHQNGPFLAP